MRWRWPAFMPATEAASSVSEAASLALGLQNDGDDPNAMALAGFHASRADSNKQLHERILAAAAAATGQAPAASASTTVSAATASATASAATPTPTPPKPVQGVDGSIAMSTETPTPTSRPPPSSGELQGEPAWLLRASNSSALLLNAPARAALTTVRQPGGTTIHFTFGSAVMMDFVKNWLHFVNRAQLEPFLVGAADTALFKFCTDEQVASAAISPELDVWTYQRKPKLKEAVYQIQTEWKYFRHHNSDFLEMGLVKVAFLWELLSAGFSVLISDLDVVWLNGHWQW